MNQGSTLRMRWISAAVGIPLFLGLALWGAVPFSVAVFVLAALGLGELLRAYGAAGITVNLPTAVMGMILPAWAWTAERSDTVRTPGPIVAAALLWLMAAMTWEVISASRTGEMHAGRNLAYGLLCGVYVSLFSGLAWLRGLGELGSWGVLESQSRAAPTLQLLHSATPLLLTVFCVWATDSFAFFVGRSLGKHKLAPNLSPGKTVEGAAGGFAFGVLFGGLFGWVFFRNVGLGLAVGAVAGIFGQVGDLFESALKRELGIKDFGGILPGHGGVLDRFDSLLFVGPLAALLFHLWPL